MADELSLAGLAFGILGGAATLAGQYIARRWNRPILRAEFGDGSEFTHTRLFSGLIAERIRFTKGSRVSRVRVTNTGRTVARRCRGFLVSVDYLNPDGRAEPYLLDTIPLL